MSQPNRYKRFILPGEPKGSLVGLDYFTPAPRDATKRAKAIILLIDIFGLALPNPKIVADHLAEHVGVDVWIPDFFNGKPPLSHTALAPYIQNRAGIQPGFIDMCLILVTILPSLPKIISNRPSVVDPRVQEFIKRIKAERGYERIGAVGYSFGAAMAIRLGSADLLNTMVVAHPLNVTKAEIRAVKIPTSWALAEDDSGFKDKDVKGAQAIFKEQEGKADHVEYEFQTWKGTAHGFAIRPNLTVPDVKAGYEGALHQTVTWFKKTL